MNIGQRKKEDNTMIDFITLSNLKNLISGVVVHPLKVHKDESGILIEALKTTWTDIYGEKYPFAQCYFSVTPAGQIRDRDVWHVHPTKQDDRFLAARGDIITAIYDSRPQSPTYGVLNLFKMGQNLGDECQFSVLIPKGTLHGFAVISKTEALLLNFPTTIYDLNEEGRVSHLEAQAKFSDKTLFNWDKVISEAVKI
jgi:dTDP-4-dehydrorhamnose 3,5-epimerase